MERGFHSLKIEKLLQSLSTSNTSSCFNNSTLIHRITLITMIYLSVNSEMQSCQYVKRSGIEELQMILIVIIYVQWLNVRNNTDQRAVWISILRSSIQKRRLYFVSNSYGHMHRKNKESKVVQISQSLPLLLEIEVILPSQMKIV